MTFLHLHNELFTYAMLKQKVLIHFCHCVCYLFQYLHFLLEFLCYFLDSIFMYGILDMFGDGRFVPGESKKFYTFERLWNKKYAANIQN